ncbi:MAG TPA: type I glyceraldehyde-3-phosphate dehydrogenase [Ktedonobacterales bacterium]|nr:type I glyceraldehyde-3-phosphate dehydrogenase [Ktedonobacterales bacterium]
MRIGINGFGRIGRLVLRSALARGVGLDVVAINDRGDAEINAHLFQFDSTYGGFRGRVEAREGSVVIDDRPIRIVSHLNPLDIPWRDLGVELVIEATGVFTTGEQAAAHLQAGAARVLITAPSKGADVTLVAGVNEHAYDPSQHQLISAASCTTNCLAPVAKVLLDRFGIRHGMMSTIHAYTNDQRILDRSHKDPRRARAGAENIIPTTTGATKALGEVLPELAGKFQGLSYRVPTLTVSVIDLAVALNAPATVDDINNAFREAARGPLAGVLGFTRRPLVSSDFRGDSRSSIVDGLLTALLPGENVARVVSWYDNEWGYASRVVDLARYINECERGGLRPERVRVVERERLERALRTASYAPEGLPL